MLYNQFELLLHQPSTKQVNDSPKLAGRLLAKLAANSLLELFVHVVTHTTVVVWPLDLGSLINDGRNGIVDRLCEFGCDFLAMLCDEQYFVGIRANLDFCGWLFAVITMMQ
jgi:hypothetical protein